MIATERIYISVYERLLRGVAAAESLSRRCRLHHRCRVYHSDWVGGVSGVGIAKLDAASCGRAFAHGISDCSYSCLGLRRHAPGNSRHPGITPTPQFANADCVWRDHFRWSGLLPFASGVLAQKIASALQAKLSPNEKEQLDRQPTKDPNAYLLFIQAHNYANRPDHLRDDSLKAEELFEQAIKLDPKFAAAFAGLSMVESWIYHSFEPTPARREKARLNADESLRLQPNLPEGHLALGFSYYYGDRDYERAFAEFEIAKRDLPNEAQAYMAIGAIQRRQGKWAESTANLEKAAALDPKNVSVLTNLGYSYMALRNFEAADKIFDSVAAAAPQSLQAALLKGGVAVLWKGDLSVAEKQLSSVPPEVDPGGLMTWVRVWCLTLERKFPEALQVLEKV